MKLDILFVSAKMFYAARERFGQFSENPLNLLFHSFTTFDRIFSFYGLIDACDVLFMTTYIYKDHLPAYIYV